MSKELKYKFDGVDDESVEKADSEDLEDELEEDEDEDEEEDDEQDDSSDDEEEIV